MDDSTSRERLQPILDLTREYEGEEYHSFILNQLHEQGLDTFLRSNELWGGSGSVADQLGVSEGREIRRKIEGSLIALGEYQLSEGVVNCRTRHWVETFKKWAETGI